MATVGFRIYDYGYGARRTPMSEAERVREKERSDAYIRDLKRQLAIAEEELRQERKNIEEEQRSRSAVCILPEPVQTQPCLTATNDASQALIEAVCKEDSSSGSQSVLTENIAEEGRLPANSAAVSVEEPLVAEPTTNAEIERWSSTSEMEANTTYVPQENSTSDQTGQPNTSETAEHAVSEANDAKERDDMNCLAGAGSERDSLLPTKPAACHKGCGESGAAPMATSKLVLTSDKPAVQLGRRGDSEQENSGSCNTVVSLAVDQRSGGDGDSASCPESSKGASPHIWVNNDPCCDLRAHLRERPIAKLENPVNELLEPVMPYSKEPSRYEYAQPFVEACAPCTPTAGVTTDVEGERHNRKAGRESCTLQHVMLSCRRVEDVYDPGG